MLCRRVRAARSVLRGRIRRARRHTIGGVIAPGEVIMEIVPDSDDLQVEAKLRPKDIDQVRVGQKTLVRLSAFNQRTTPQLNGVVSYVSADLSRDKQTDTLSTPSRCVVWATFSWYPECRPKYFCRPEVAR